MKKSLLLMIFVSALCVAAHAQFGGKAEANRVKFPRGRSSTTLIGTLSNGEEMEFVFTARKGQKAYIKNANRNLFDVRVFSNELGLETEYDSSPSFNVDLPEKGDYLLYVRRKAGGPAAAKFSVTLTIR